MAGWAGPKKGRAPVGHDPAGEAERLGMLGSKTFDEYRRTGSHETLDAAVTAYTDSIDALPPGHPSHAQHILDLVKALYARFERVGDAADLDDAIDTIRQAVQHTPPGRPDRARCLSGLGFLLHSRFFRAGADADLDAAIDTTRQAVQHTPPGHPDRAEYLARLGGALRARFESAGDAPDLDAAIGLLRQAVELIPSGHTDRAWCLSEVGAALQARFHRDGDGADLDAAIDALRQAVEVTPPTHPDRPSRLRQLGAVLQNRFRYAGNAADLDGAVDALRQAVDLAPPGHKDRPVCLSTLGLSLRGRFGATGDDADLDAAVQAIRQAVDLHPASTDALSSLGIALQTRYDRHGDAADLDAAVDAVRQAVDLTPPGHTDRPKRLSILGRILQLRFYRDRDGADLDVAIEAIRQAVDLTPPLNPARPDVLSDLAGILHLRYTRNGDTGDLDAAIDAGRQAVDLSHPGSRGRPASLFALAFALHDRFVRNRDATDLDAAIDAMQRAVRLSPSPDPDHPRYLSALGVFLRSRFVRSGDAADLNAAVDAGRQGADLAPPGHAIRAWHLYSLGAAIHTRFRRDGDAADLEASMACSQEASQVPAAEPQIRLMAALAWGLTAIEARRSHDAAEGYEAAVGLLPQAAWHGVPRAARAEQLALWRGLTADAAACMVRDGRPARAVELLEQGRSLLWTQILNLRTDLGRLAGKAPELAARLDGIRAILDAPPAPPESTPASGSPAADSTWPHDDLRRRKAREWDEVLADVRALEGFRYFLAAVPYAQLAAAAADGPVVILNASRHGCHALIIDAHRDQPEVISLPMTMEVAVGQADTLLQAVGRADPDAVLNVLDWLWDAAAEPALAALGHTSAHGPGDPWPRVWWCPTGPLSFLPVHAAGHHPRNRAAGPSTDCVSGRVISSYTPTLAALTRSHGVRSAAPVRHLGIGMVTTPGLPPLPAVSAELRTLARRFPGDTHQRLTGAQATRAAVLAALPACSWIHLTCHACQVHADPDSSGFAVWDGTLTIADLVTQHARHRDLAFLSACQTAAGSTRHPDEAIHLASAMQFLGYRHVIATLWTVADSPTARLADSVYATLTISGRPDSTRAAEALHYATNSLRRLHPGNPLLWAPYIHLGP